MGAMRGRKAGLLPLEAALIEVGLAFAAEGELAFHGFRATLRLREQTGSSLFVTHGALYKALDRLEKRGLLTSAWEDADVALREGRPRRRLYRVTAAGEAALNEARPIRPLARRMGEAPA